ncbi:MAG: bestrophin family ion channel, partial [Bacteroidota bacterium]
MYVSRVFNPTRLIAFSARPILVFSGYAAIVVCLFLYAELEFLKIPWVPLTLIGIAVAFYVGFKNNSAYDRTWEARKIWGGIVNA